MARDESESIKCEIREKDLERSLRQKYKLFEATDERKNGIGISRRGFVASTDNN